MTANKDIVQRYMDGFNEGDHEKILSCLNDNIVWDMPGYFNLKGKADFDKEIENDMFTGRPEINVTRMTEENNVVCAEGSVKAMAKNGRMLDALFCDVFEMVNGKISRLTTYQMNLTNPFE